jgi:hypothetical protein
MTIAALLVWNYVCRQQIAQEASKRAITDDVHA